ncbi:MAG: D-alanyl-D-alanine carboxypeptidase/D-alanyl-D-alanine-endopeptidase [Pseudomonadota bacterium]
MSNKHRIIALIALIIGASAPASGTAATPASIDISRSAVHRGFNSSETSISIADAGSGRELAGHLPDLALNPASCMKIITSTAALALLGPAHGYRTDFLTDRRFSGGTIGTLYVRGDGNPMLVNEDLMEIAGWLHEKGLRRITGGIAIDNSFFDSYEFPRKGGNETRAYTAKTAATSVNFNSVAVVVAPGARSGAPGVATTNPPTEYFRIVNKLVTGGRFRVDIAMKQDGDGEAIVVSGSIPPRAAEQQFYRSVTDPARYAGSVIKYMLEQNGIAVEGAVRPATTPAQATLLLYVPSKPMSEILREMNKRSNNFMAEQTLKHLGAVKYGAPGSTAKGVKALEEYLASIGIAKGGYTLENGSGLSAETRISARQLVRVLSAAYRNSSIRDAFMDSLSVLGIDGTTKSWRFAPDLTGRILVKTGTINSVSALAGYAPTASGKLAAFAILANGLPRGAWVAHVAELEVVRAITEAQQ